MLALSCLCTLRGWVHLAGATAPGCMHLTWAICQNKCRCPSTSCNCATRQQCSSGLAHVPVYTQPTSSCPLPAGGILNGPQLVTNVARIGLQVLVGLDAAQQVRLALDTC